MSADVIQIPLLEARLTDDGLLWYVLCPWCGIRHHHAMPVGRAVCHCHREGGPFERTGYIGRLSGDQPGRAA